MVLWGKAHNSRQIELKINQFLMWRLLECCGISLIKLLIPTKKSEMYWPLYYCNIHTLLGPGHTSFCHLTFVPLGINSINSWKCSSEIWAHIDVAVSHSLLQIYQLSFTHVITSQRSSLVFGLRPGVHGSLRHVWEANLTFVTWHVFLQEAAIRRYMVSNTAS